jgi:hypothetical protein
VTALTAVIAWFRTQRHRAYIYRGLLGTSPVFVSYGLVTDEKAALLLAAAAAWLGVGLATANTPTTEES